MTDRGRHMERWQDELLECYRRYKRAERIKRAGWLFACGSLCTAAGALLARAL